MQAIRLIPDQVDKLVQHAHSAYPEEACGLIAGKVEQASHIFPIENVADDPKKHYVMSPDTLLQTFKEIDDLGLELIGTYHSHPNTPPIPSQTDKHDAVHNLPNVVHIIISLEMHLPQIKAWHIGQLQVDSVDIILGKQKAYDYQPQNRLQLQQGAVVISTLLAVAFLLFISFMLLPPAPPIP